MKKGYIQYIVLLLFCISTTMLYNNCVSQARGSIKVVSLYKPDDVVIYEQPSIDKIEGAYFNAADGEISHITKFDIHKMDKELLKEVPQKWTVGDYTGLIVPSLEKSRFERVVSSDTPSTAIQFYGNEAGILVYPSNQPSLASERNPITISQEWNDMDDVRPWADPQSAFVYTSDIQIPKVSVKNSRATAKVVAMMKFKDANSGAQFWIKNIIYDNHSQYVKESAITEEDQDLTYGVVTTLFKDHAKYNTTISGQYSNDTWKGYKKFSFAITPANFSNILGDLKKHLQENELQDDFSTNPSDYVLLQYSVRPEIIYPEYKQDVSERKRHPTYLGLSVRNIKLMKTKANKAVADCGLDWEQMGVFSCEGKKEHQQICGCRPMGFENTQAWSATGSECYSRSTKSSCKVAKSKSK